MRIIKTGKSEKEEITEEMKKFFVERTNRHINLVRKYCKILSNQYPELLERAKVHDDSKFEEPEKTPYIYITWQYKCKDEGKRFDLPDSLKDEMTKATEHHVKNNSHHPEYHSKTDAPIINRENRDKPPKEMVDATSMPDLDISEMVADWCGMSEEKGTNPKDWADKNINIRWKFTKRQVDLIYKLINDAWSKK